MKKSSPKATSKLNRPASHLHGKNVTHRTSSEKMMKLGLDTQTATKKGKNSKGLPL